MTVTVRKAVPGEEYDINRVIIKTWKSSYRGIIDDTYLDTLDEDDTSRLDRLRTNIENESIYVSSDGGKIIGIAAFGKARDAEYINSGEVIALYVLREFQRSGIGRRLMGAVKGELRYRGCRSMIIDCLTGNLACRFYETKAVY